MSRTTALLDAARSVPAAELVDGHLRMMRDGQAPADEHMPPWVRAMQSWQPSLDRLGWRKVEVKHAVQGLIRAGKVGALVAAGGTGKTTLLLILAVCHATGRQFLGLDVMVGTFIILTNDDPLEDLEGALVEVVRAMNLTDAEMSQVAARVRLHSVQGESGTKTFTASVAGTVVPTGLEVLLQEAVRGISDLVGVALDTLRQFSGGSSNDEQVIKLTIAGATDFALRTGAYVVLPAHTGKQNFRDGVTDMYCGSGSAAIADNCRFVLLLQTANWADIESKVRRTGQERGDPLVLISTRGSLLMKPLEPIYLHRDGFHIGRVAGTTMSRDERAAERDRDILRAVRHGADTKTDVYRIVGGKKADTLARVDDLVMRGHIGSQNGSRKFMLSGSGAAFLEASK